MTDDSAACAVNLGPLQSVRRLVFGIVMLLGASIGLAVMIHRGLPLSLRLALFPVWWASMVGLLEARRRT
jgi:hypothetical protein